MSLNIQPQEIDLSSNMNQSQNQNNLNNESSKELKVNSLDNSKRVMYQAKILLSKHDEIEIVAGTGGAPIAVRAAESLVRLGYVTYLSIKTDTILSITNKRRTKFSIRLKKTPYYQQLFEENEMIRIKTQEIENM